MMLALLRRDLVQTSSAFLELQLLLFFTGEGGKLDFAVDFL